MAEKHQRRASEVWVPVRRNPPKIVAHHPILVECVTCPHRPNCDNNDGKANHACEADEHDLEIIALKCWGYKTGRVAEATDQSVLERAIKTEITDHLGREMMLKTLSWSAG